MTKHKLLKNTNFEDLTISFTKDIQKIKQIGYKKRAEIGNLLNQKLSLIEKEFYNLSPEIRHQAKDFFQKQVLSFTNKSDLCHHSYSKPRGYAGDFMAMEKIWHGRANEEDCYLGEDEIGKALNAFTLDSANCLANEYRVHYFRNIIKNYKNSDIASIGCGSVIELQELYKEDKNLGDNNFYLFDGDQGALDFIKNKFLNSNKIHYFYGNVLRQIIRFNKNQKFDLIYSSGLFDYLSVEQAQKIAKNLFSLLKPNGTLIITNAHPKNPSRFWMECVGEWNLNYKDESELRKVVNFLPNSLDCSIAKDPFDTYQYITAQNNLL